VDPDGLPVSFENLSAQQVVKHLRGEPGSEVQLLMERLPSDENGESHIFDVSIQRSLLVIQPPY
jgi:C-terminal processing protease CtpA/Prc